MTDRISGSKSNLLKMKMWYTLEGNRNGSQSSLREKMHRFRLSSSGIELLTTLYGIRCETALISIKF